MTTLIKVWHGYKSVAHRIGVFQSKLILSIFYFLLTPFGIFFSLFKDELKIKSKQNSAWIIKKNQSQLLKDLQKQY